MSGKNNKKKKSSSSTFLLLLIFFVGLSVLLYPTISNYWNSKTQTEAIVDYENILKNLPVEDYDSMFAEAERYNTELYNNVDFPLLEYDKVKGYFDILDVTGTGMMGYIEIPKIDVELPIYHGTNEDILNVAVGHMQGTSFPIGGTNTHAILSAHRGLPSAKLFSDLDRMEVGDTFTVKILDKTLTYEIDQARIVLPEEVDDLMIVDGGDYCTLLTCTPYGINTHRLLVRGQRTETVQHKSIYITSEAYQIDTLIVTPVVAMPMLIVLMIIVLAKPVKKKKKIK